MHFRYRAAVTLAATGLLASSVYAVVTSDAFVRRLAHGFLARKLRSPARIASASFSFRDGVVIRGLEILDPDEPLGPPAAVVESLHADFGLFLFGEGPKVTSIALERPHVRLRRLADGTLVTSHLLWKSDEKDQAVLPPIRVTDGTLTYSDPAIIAGGPVELTGVTATIDPKGGAREIVVTGRTAELGPIRMRAFQVPEGGVTADLALDAIPVDPALLARLRLPGAAEAAALAGRGTVRGHVELAWHEGQSPVVRAEAELAGFVASVRLSDTAEPFEVTVTSGAAKLEDGVVVLNRLELHGLGATLRCDGATLSELGSTAGARVRADLAIGGLAVADALDPHLPLAARRVVEAFGLRGQIAAQVLVRGKVAAPEVEIEADVTGGRATFEGYVREDGLRHGFPWEATDIAGRVSFTAPSRLRLDATGRHGAAKVRLEGSLDYASGDEMPDIAISVEDAPLDQDLRAGFQERAELVFDRWNPSGVAKRIDVRVVREPHTDGPFGVTTEISIELDGRASLRPRLLPIEFGGVTGRIRILYPERGDHRAERVELTRVTAQGGGVELHVDGHVDTDRHVAEDDLVVEGKVAELGGATRAAVLASTEFIPQSVKKLLVDLGAEGPCGVRAEIAGDPDRRRDLVTIELLGASVTGYRDVPFAARDLTGTVVVDGDEVRFAGIRGEALGAEVRGTGRLTGIASGDVQPDLRIEADQLPLAEPLRSALGPLAETAAEFWEKLRPVGEEGTLGTRADAALALRPATDATPVEIWLAKIQGPIRPLGLEFDTLGGAMHWDGRETTARLDASIGGAEIAVRRAHVDLETGVIEVDADTRGLRFPEDVEPLMSPATVERISDAIPGRNLHANGLELRYDPRDRALDLAGEVSVRPRSRRAGREPGLAPDGAMDLEHVRFRFPDDGPVTFDGTLACAGFRMTLGLDVEDLTGTIRVGGTIREDDGVSVSAATEDAKLVLQGFTLAGAAISASTGPGGARADLTASFKGGRINAKYGPGPEGVAYRGEVHLRGADLARLAGTESEVKGRVDGDVLFRNVSGASDDLTGSVELSVRDGSLGSFPVVSTIFNLFPGAGDLTDASLQGSLRGPAIEIRDLVIKGPVLSLTHGRGSIGFDGALDVSLETDIPGLTRIPLTSIPIPVLSTLLSKVHVGGTIRNPTTALRPLTSGLDNKGGTSWEPQPRGEPDRPAPSVW